MSTTDDTDGDGEDVHTDADMSVSEGDRYRDELNNSTIEVLDITDGVATVESGDGEATWRERVADIRNKLATGDFTRLGRGATVTAKAEIPNAADAQLLYPEAETAAEVAADLGLDGVHDHDLDGETWWMPGPDHETFEAALAEMEQQEFAGYEDFDACVRDHSDKDDPEAYCASIMREVKGKADTAADEPVDTKAEFTAGDAVRWTWNGEPVHGRVAEKRPEQATVSGNTITGDEGEPVYVIDEWDDRVGAFRRENVAKPESSLDESRKDLPDRTDDNYVSSEAWEALTTTVSASDFTTRELDYAVTAFDGVLMKGAPNEWVVPSEDPVVYRYDIPEMYLRDREPSFFVPDAGMAEAARKVREWADEHPDEFAAGGDDGELLRRAAQIVEHHDRGEPLAIEYWREIENFHNRKHAQDAHELAAEYEGEPWRDNGYAGHEGWGGDAGYEQAQRVMDHVEAVESEAAVELRGAVATEQSLGPETITKAESNEVDLDALDGDLREAVEADNYYIYGKASIEQWDDDHPPTFIQMDALEAALDRYFDSETAPGIISRHHQDIPVGKPVRSFEFDEPTTLEIDGEHYEFAAGDTARSHVEDADGDGRPELWLAANIDGETEMGKKTRVLAAQGDLNGFSVTVHRNRDEMTQEGRIVTDCDLHAVTIGTDDQIKNPGSEFDVASIGGKLRRVAHRVRNFISGGGAATTSKSTPEGVPNDYNYLPPDEEPPEDHDVVESNRGGTYVSPGPVALDSDEAEAVPEGFSPTAMQRPGDIDDPTELPAGTPVVAERPDGTVEGGVVTADVKEERGGLLVFYDDEDGVSREAGGASPTDIAALGDPESMSSGEKSRLAANNFAQKDFSDVADVAGEETAAEIQQTSEEFLQALDDGDVALEIADRTNNITNTPDESSALGSCGSSQEGPIRLTYRTDDRVTNHEMGHALMGGLGYNTGTPSLEDSGDQLTPTQVAREYSGSIPDFGDEFVFGENVAEFDEFLFRDADGEIPGQEAAELEREIFKSDVSEWEFDDVPRADSQRADEVAEAEEQRISQLRDLSPGEIVSVTDPHGTDYVATFEQRDDDAFGSADEEFRFNPIAEADGSSTNKMSVSIDVEEDSFTEMDSFNFNADFNGSLDREATAEAVGASSSDGDDSPRYARGDLADDDGGIGEIPDPSDEADDLGEALAAEANRAWARNVGMIEGGADDAAKSQAGTGYGLTNPHEFAATATEAVRTGQRSKVATRSQSQPEFMAILMAILEPSGELDDIIEQLDLDL